MRPTEEELEDIKRIFEDHADENAELFAHKHSIYGPGNINRRGKLGVIERMEDNLERLKNILAPNNGKVYDAELIGELAAHEEDAWRDLSVFGIIGLMLFKGEWPK